MTKLALAAPLALLAAALVGCGSPPRTAPATATIQPDMMPYAAGTGVVQAVRPAPAPLGAAAGPTAPGQRATTASAAPSQGDMQRLGIRMDNGRTIWVDTPSREFRPGMRVQLSEANEIRPM
jgi:hypothetical protein